LKYDTKKDEEISRQYENKRKFYWFFNYTLNLLSSIVFPYVYFIPLHFQSGFGCNLK